MSWKFAAAIDAAPARCALLTVLLAATVACATPIGATREDPKILYRTLTKSVLSADEPTEFTAQLLRRRELEEAFKRDPEATLTELHRTLAGVAAFAAAREADRLFAIAELSFIQGNETNKREYLLAAALYAYAFLTNEQRDDLRTHGIDPERGWHGAAR